MTLRIVPVGSGVSVEVLDRLAGAVAQRLSLGCHVETEPLDAAFAWEQKRNQYWSTALLKALLDRAPLATARGSEAGRVLGVTELDLYVPVLTFVFGEAQVSGRAAIVSLHRLRNEFYGLSADPEILFERMVKEAMHELGHTYGLRHCPDWQCAMASSHGVERLDVKSAEFCPKCAAEVGAALVRAHR